MFKNKKILITGGTGSLGNALTQRLLEQGVDTIRIFSRNESKQLEMESKFNDERLRFLIGDVRDYERLERAVEDIHIVFHAAALKHVPVIEYNPFEAIKTNILGSQNVINACLHENVDRAICIGTDKAVSPLNTYGATKLLMEKLFVTAKNYLKKERHQTKFIALRYGNVLGSSGSVIPKFIDQIKNKEKLMDHPNLIAFAVWKMKNLYIDELRKSKNLTSLTDQEGKDMEIIDDKQPDMYEKMELKSKSKKVLNIIKGMGEKCQQILNLYLSGMSYKEMAEIAKIPIGTVMSRLLNCRKELAGLLAV